MGTCWASGDTIANGIRLHYYRTGGDKPPLVLSHGFSSNGPCWVWVVQQLVADYDVVFFDHRGHGLSETPATGYTSDDRAADIKGLIEALHLGHPRIVGHSMGASAVAAAAANYPDLFRAAVLEDPPWRDRSCLAATPPEQVRAEREAMIQTWKDTPRAELRVILGQENPSWTAEELEHLTDAKQQMSVNNALSIVAINATSWQEVLRRITCPLLIIAADPAKGGIVTDAIATEAAQLWQKGQLVRLANAGHNVHNDQREKYIEALKAFLAQV
jgi:pimeloyl-ACP methyl ester carboxylesterase